MIEIPKIGYKEGNFVYYLVSNKPPSHLAVYLEWRLSIKEFDFLNASIRLVSKEDFRKVWREIEHIEHELILWKNTLKKLKSSGYTREEVEFQINKYQELSDKWELSI